MPSLELLLSPNEHITESVDFLEEPNVDFSIHTVDRPDLPYGDEVLLAVRVSSMPCILAGGNSVNLQVLHGFGRLAVIDLATGKLKDAFIEPGTYAEIEPNNSLYWLEKLSEDPLIIRDHCDDFEPSNEPSLKDFVKALSSLML